jgi:hypothetical protein
MLGMVIGNVINPYFPHNIYLFWNTSWTKFKVGSDFAVAVGGEWYPYSGMELLTDLPVAMIAMLIGYILFTPKNGKLPEKATFFLVFSSILLAAQFRSKRFAEYFPPFAVLFAAFSLQAFRIPQALQLPEHFKRDIEPYLDAEKKSAQQERHHSLKLACVTVLGVLLTVYFVLNTKGLHVLGFNQDGLAETIAGNDTDDRYRRAMAWATGVDANGKENIPAGERIFNCNWDDFPKLFLSRHKAHVCLRSGPELSLFEKSGSLRSAPGHYEWEGHGCGSDDPREVWIELYFRRCKRERRHVREADREWMGRHGLRR